MRNKTTYCICFLCFLLLASCTRPSGVLSQKEMENVLYDMYLTQALTQEDSRYKSSESRDTLFFSVLAKYDIRQADFDSSLVWYSNQGSKYFKINNNISRRLKAFRDKMNGKVEKIHVRKEYNGYILPPSVWIGGGLYANTFAFDLDSLKFGKKEIVDTASFVFNFKTLGVPSDSSVIANVCFEYQDTNVNIQRYVLQNSLTYSIQKPKRLNRHLTHIYGYIHVNDSNKWALPIYLYDLSYKKINHSQKSTVSSRSKSKTRVKSNTKDIKKIGETKEIKNKDTRRVRPHQSSQIEDRRKRVIEKRNVNRELLNNAK